MNASVAPLCLPGLVADAVQVQARVAAHEPLARQTWRLRLHCRELARRIVPGQFFMIRVPGRSDPLLGRPFALFDTDCDANGTPVGLDFGYVVIGKMTGLLSTLRVGDDVELWGPLGNGFPTPPSGHLVLVAGGIGQTPFLAVIREALRQRRYGLPARESSQIPDRITLCYGVRSREFLAAVEDFQATGIDVRIATDDGSVGHHGFVTDLLKEILAEPQAPSAVYCCGPEPMMRAVQRITADAQVPCWLSLETPMACGFGACFSCVTRILQPDGTWDYRRVCVEGPVFPAEQVVFE